METTKGRYKGFVECYCYYYFCDRCHDRGPPTCGLRPEEQEKADL